MNSTTNERLWSILAEVKDPEIPVVSITELGIVRNVDCSDQGNIIIITPTYSGCPATDIIPVLIKEIVDQRGIRNVTIKTQISPAWTTDWITEEGKIKLKKFGIAPPVEKTSDPSFLTGQMKEVPCPFCNSANTELVSRFGSTPCKSAYQCKACLEPFDYFKCH
jgi:ring-1,2-phenylacetyl-CoA epoxidase subunit PaaD